MIHLDDSIHKQVLNASVRQSLRIIIFAGIVTHWPVFSYLNQKMVLISNIILSPEEERISSLVNFSPFQPLYKTNFSFGKPALLRQPCLQDLSHYSSTPGSCSKHYFTLPIQCFNIS